MFVLSGYGSWDEGIKLIQRNGTASEDFLGDVVALYGDRDLVGGHFIYERGDASWVAYIFHRVNGVWKEEANLVPADGVSGGWLVYDVDISGVTDIIGYPFNNYMGIDNGYVYVFFRRYNVKWEEAHKLTPAYAEAGDWFGVSVNIFGNTPVIGSQYDNGRGDDSGYGYVYTSIGGKWNKSGKRVPEDGAAYDEFG